MEELVQGNLALRTYQRCAKMCRSKTCDIANCSFALVATWGLQHAIYRRLPTCERLVFLLVVTPRAKEDDLNSSANRMSSLSAEASRLLEPETSLLTTFTWDWSWSADMYVPFSWDLQVLACYEFVRHLRNVMFDYSRIVMGGNSRGGYSAMNIATRTDWATHVHIVRPLNLNPNSFRQLTNVL